MADREKLTALEERFVDEYLVDLNASAAILRAGYNTKYPDKMGSQVLGRARVKKAIEKAQKGLQRRTHVTQERIIEQLAKMAFYDVTDFSQLYTERVPVKRNDGSVEEVEMQFVRYNENFDGTVAGNLSKGRDGIKLELPNREKALELLGKHLGMWTDKVSMDQTLSNKDGVPFQMEYLSSEERRARIDELNRKRGNGANPTS